MLFTPRSKHRPVHLGPFPLEALKRDERVLAIEAARPPRAAEAAATPHGTLAEALDHYRTLVAQFADGALAPAQAPLPDDLAPRAEDLKGGACFMDASGAGICRIVSNAWLIDAAPLPHDFALVILVEHPRRPEAGNAAHDWTGNAIAATAAMRAAEIATCLALYIRNLGFEARAHIAGDSALDLERLAVMAGLTLRDGDSIAHPYIGKDFALAAVSTNYQLTTDVPLHADACNARSLAYWWGINGARSGRERNRRRMRASHLSAYPMETVKRINRPTTLILDDEVPRVPKRAAFFQRALHGDLGDKAKRERARFAFKTPFSFALLQIIRAMVKFQDGPVAAREYAQHSDAGANAQAIKSLSYTLGADLTGICEIPRYAWYSHKEDGREIKPYHRYAVVMLIDQGYDTMEGASGDDWISGAQSMRGYLRGAEIAGIMGEFLRAQGFPARSQTNADSDLLHIPLILWAGLGELSRIGELVLNPFVGPRFKSVVLTTDLPLVPDKPIDFGLQTFCGNCLKCARECPCDAIPFGDKTMFNGYEIWKPDVERCTRYRVTNPKGAACGRCMKTCPINKVVDSDGALVARMASWLGIHAMWLKPMLVPIATRVDDWLGNGKRNPVKKWWFDHEFVNGIAIDPPKGTNARDLDIARKVDPATHKVAVYPANTMPPPDEADPVPVNRKPAVAAASQGETPSEARTRAAKGGPTPVQYSPTPPRGESSEAQTAVRNPYA